MRRNLLRIIKTNQLLNVLCKNCRIKTHYHRSQLGEYNYLLRAKSSKYNSLCLIQGRYKATHNVYKFNRHLIRSGLVKDNFSSIKSFSW